MFQIGFGMESDYSVTHWWMDIIRSFLAVLDRVVYSLLILIYQILFNIADTTVFSTETIKNFYSRVQLIIGVFMIFKLCMSLLQTVVNPDNLTDKNNGLGQIITRILIMLVLFVSIIPLNIPAEEGTYNAYLNESGLLFGTLYSFQSRVLKTNVLGKLILGNESTDSGTGSNMDGEENATSLAAFVLKGFVRINLKENATSDGAFDEDGNLIEENLICTLSNTTDGDDNRSDIEVVNNYSKENATVGDVLDNINEWCDGPSGDGHQDNYVFAYTPIISTICGGFLTVVLFGYCVEVAIRAIKLAILRLIAPIPIISYVDPKSTTDGAFSSWIKALTSTYIDLFLRLAIVYLIMFMVEDIITNGLDLPIFNGLIGIISTIFIIMGAFFFAKQAPKFIKDALGIKSEGGSGLFSGLGKIAGVGAATLGAVGSARANYKARKEVHPEQGIRNVGSGLLGAMGGMKTGLDASTSAKDHIFGNTTQAMKERNAKVLAAGYAGSTAGGRAKSTIDSLLRGESSSSILAREIENLESQRSGLEAIKKRASGEMVKKNWTKGALGIQKDNNGHDIGDVNYKSFMAAKEAAAARGEANVRFANTNGKIREISMEQAIEQYGYLLSNNEDDYIKETVAGNQKDKVLVNLVQDIEVKSQGKIRVDGRDSVSGGVENLDIEITNKKREKALQEKNDLYVGKK